MKYRAILLVVSISLLGTAFQAQAEPITLTPTSLQLVLSAETGGGVPGMFAYIEAAGFIGFGSQELYKSNQVDGEEPTDPFAGSYETTYGLAATGLPEGSARISWMGVPYPHINASPVYALIKDGNIRAWYLYDISGWNGQDAIEFSNFYIGAGGQTSISHVSLHGVNVQVPDGGTTATLLGLALVGLGFVRRLKG